MAAEPDDLYTLRAQFWLGHYEMALEEAKAITRRPMAPHLKQEREEFISRANLALGLVDKVQAAADGSSTGACRILRAGSSEKKRGSPSHRCFSLFYSLTLTLTHHYVVIISPLFFYPVQPSRLLPCVLSTKQRRMKGLN